MAMGRSQPPYDRTFVALSRDQLAGVIAALDALNLPKETRQEFDKAIHETFTIARMLGNVEQALSARKNMTRARAELMQKGREKGIEDAEARRVWIRGFYTKRGLQLEHPGLTRLILLKLGEPTDKKEKAALTRKINRDLARMKTEK